MQDTYLLTINEHIHVVTFKTLPPELMITDCVIWSDDITWTVSFWFISDWTKLKENGVKYKVV